MKYELFKGTKRKFSRRDKEETLEHIKKIVSEVTAQYRTGQLTEYYDNCSYISDCEEWRLIFSSFKNYERWMDF